MSITITITKDFLYEPGSTILHDETGRSWTIDTPEGPVEPTLYAEVYDDDGEHYYSITVEGLPLGGEGDNGEDYAYDIHRHFENHAGATLVKYRGRPELIIG